MTKAIWRGANPPMQSAAEVCKDIDQPAISITYPERAIDSELETTKYDLAVFYSEVCKWILPHLCNRPVSLLRASQGIAQQQSFQKHPEQSLIPAVKQLDLALDPDQATLMEIDSQAALLGAVQMGAIELHTWGCQRDRLEHPDRIVLDLDPDPSLPWRSILEATRLLLAVLDELKLHSYLKTTGGKGMHIVIPLASIAGWDYIKEFSKAISQFMARQIPQRFATKMGPKNRVGKIFVDYLRNQRGASTVAAYALRARPGLPVSVPITREELVKISGSAQWNISNINQRLGKLETDPWEGYNHPQRITNTMWRKLGAVPSY